MSSYTLSERVTAQSILFYGLALPVYRTALAVDKSCQAIRTALPHLLFALIILAKALGLVAIIAGTMTAVALIPATFWLGLMIISVFAWLTFPRSTRK